MTDPALGVVTGADDVGTGARAELCDEPRTDPGVEGGLPEATARTAVASSRRPASFVRYPRAPARSAPTIDASSA